MNAENSTSPDNTEFQEHNRAEFPLQKWKACEAMQPIHKHKCIQLWINKNGHKTLQKH